ncbi:MAG: tRNA (adenosine(37)-N6)-threonylcarbamoyltransferase complex ATPase subunit type 1 TsaE [Paracoccaceae bacterium]
MSQRFCETIFLPDERATTDLGIALAPVFTKGDILLLNGPVGAGKSHLARAIIQARLGYPEDVPSPTYTLVQTYFDQKYEIFHADLYRLSDTSELTELGLDDAFQNAICLVEWAERLGPESAPKDALTVTLETKEDGRFAVLSADASRWEKVARPIEKTRFLIEAGWSGAQTTNVAGDLSSRTYQRLRQGEQSVIYMDAGDDTASTSKFLKMSSWLDENGYSAPQAIAQKPGKGLILLSDFGDQRLSTLPDVMQKMTLCLSLLADMRTKEPPDLPCPTAIELAEMTMLAKHYPGAETEAIETFRGELQARIEMVNENTNPSVSLRDFHTDNIMWLGEKEGINRLGLLDYQDAFLVHPVYDLVSLLTDARRAVSTQDRQDLIVQYAKMTGDDLEDLQRAFAVFSVQRNLRILGIFSKAALDDGKTHHVQNIPRVYGYLVEALEHPVFEGVSDELFAALPLPEKALLEQLAA